MRQRVGPRQVFLLAKKEVGRGQVHRPRALARGVHPLRRPNPHLQEEENARITAEGGVKIHIQRACTRRIRVCEHDKTITTVT
eukprot:3931976-Rhodomonas_salina.1